MADTLALVIGLVLVIEGLMPFAAPSHWRTAVLRIAELRDGQIRFVGLGAILIGLVLIIV